MADSSNLNTLTSREAVVDTLHCALLGLDSNDRALFTSTCLTTDEMVWIGGGYSISGWAAVSALFERVFQLITMHVVSNIRVTFEDDETAMMTAHAVSYHVRPEDRDAVEERSFTGYSLYKVGVVKVGGTWKIARWEAEVLRTTGDKSIVHG